MEEGGGGAEGNEMRRKKEWKGGYGEQKRVR